MKIPVLWWKAAELQQVTDSAMDGNKCYKNKAFCSHPHPRIQG